MVPQEYQDNVLRDAHREMSSRHLGVEKTYERIAREYYWPGMWHEIFHFVEECDDCQRYKTLQTAPKGLMGQGIVERLWAVLAADCMEFPLSKCVLIVWNFLSLSKFQYENVVVFQDLITRWIELRHLRSADGKSIAKAFEELILFRWEAPDYLMTDNGNEFDNKILDSVLTEYGVI